MPYLNQFSSSSDPLDMTTSSEFSSLCESAKDLGIGHVDDIRYVSRNVVVRHQRFHLLEWGDPSLPTLLFLHGGNQSAHSWDLVSLHLADRFHIIAPDFRGHGDSSHVVGGGYSHSGYLYDLAQLIHQPRTSISVRVAGASAFSQVPAAIPAPSQLCAPLNRIRPRFSQVVCGTTNWRTRERPTGN